ncbi:MAG: putative hydroxymethylpyrimidine transport system substrate-binding protein [Solirubrobacterales bacterium]|jgi:putative hydroxymethylpyrimidine transport system substrate-binding protein|nr:putative hydroxymethylpyrimidine transport system substrate-binding protein [Solirubrobacterales bacterium]
MAAMGLITFLLASCGNGTGSETTDRPRAAAGPAENVRVTLAGRKGPESAGLVMAAKWGYFEDENLDVAVLAPGSPQSPIDYVVDKIDEIGVSHQPEVMLAQRKGAPIAIVGSLIPRPTAAMIWLEKSKIRRIADLRGKTIAIPGLPFQKIFLERILERAGLSLGDVRVRDVQYDLVASLVSGRADAIFGGSANIEGIELESAGLNPVITPVSSLGVPFYEELVLIARTDYVKRKPQVIRGFMKAVRRGTAEAIEDPETAAWVIDSESETVLGTDRKEMEAEVEATLPLLSRSGSPSFGQAGRLASWMRSAAP